MTEERDSEVPGTRDGTGGASTAALAAAAVRRAQESLASPTPGEVGVQRRLPRPTLEWEDLLAITFLAVLWTLVGMAVMEPAGRASWIRFSEAVAGGIALGFGTGGASVWLRRRSLPALAREALAWAVLGACLPVAFLLGLASPLLGEIFLLLSGVAAFLASLSLGWRLTPLLAVGRFGGLFAVGFAVWNFLSRAS